MMGKTRSGASRGDNSTGIGGKEIYPKTVLWGNHTYSAGVERADSWGFTFVMKGNRKPTRLHRRRLVVGKTDRGPPGEKRIKQAEGIGG